MSRPWSEHDLAVLRDLYPDTATKQVAAALGRSVAVVYAMANASGLKKSAAFMVGPQSGRITKGAHLGPYTPWTEAELVVLRGRYPHEKSSVVAAALGRSITSVSAMARKLGIVKSEAFLASEVSGRLRKGDERGATTRFKKGIVPWTKGKKGVTTGGRETQFRKGAMPHNYVPVGTEVVASIGYWKRKIAEPNYWEFVHVLNWVAVRGPVPARYLLRFKDGNPLNPELANLECISKRDHIAQHTIMRFPRPVREVIRMSAKLRRTIEKRSSGEKQD